MVLTRYTKSCDSWSLLVVRRFWYDVKVWASIQSWLVENYCFAPEDVSKADLDLSTIIHAPFLLGCLEHHCGLRVEVVAGGGRTPAGGSPSYSSGGGGDHAERGAGGESLPPLRLCRAWGSQFKLAVDFVPSVKMVDYRKVSHHGFFSATRWGTDQFVDFLNAEQALAKAKLGGGTGAATSTRNSPSKAVVPARGGGRIPKQNLATGRFEPRVRQSRAGVHAPGCVIEKAGTTQSEGLEHALKLYIEHFAELAGEKSGAAGERDRAEAGAAGRFALQVFDEHQPKSWLLFATLGYQLKLNIGLDFGQIAEKAAYLFGEEHPLLLSLWQTKFDRLWAALMEQSSSGSGSSSSCSGGTSTSKRSPGGPGDQVCERFGRLRRWAPRRGQALSRGPPPRSGAIVYLKLVNYPVASWSLVRRLSHDTTTYCVLHHGPRRAPWCCPISSLWRKPPTFAFLSCTAPALPDGGCEVNPPRNPALPGHPRRPDVHGACLPATGTTESGRAMHRPLDRRLWTQQHASVSFEGRPRAPLSE